MIIADVTQLIKLIALNSMLIINAIEGFYVGPHTTDIMYARRKAEKDGIFLSSSDDTFLVFPDDKVKLTELSRQFGLWHGINSSMNLIVVIGALVYLIYLAQMITISH